MLHIGLSEYINCVLVNEDVRNAMLLEAADYKEATHLDPIIQKKLKYISEHFPNLIQSPLQMGYVLISKISYTDEDVSTSKKMGEVLGYPCDVDDAQYTISINAEFDESIQIFGMLANTYYPILDIFARDAFRVLTLDPFLGHIKDVTVVMKPIIREQEIINKLMLHIELSEHEIYTIQNCMFNMGFLELSKYSFDYKHPIHIGILSTLLSYSMNDPIMAFAPLHRFKNEHAIVDSINQTLELSIIDNLNTSLNKHFYK